MPDSVFLKKFFCKKNLVTLLFVLGFPVFIINCGEDPRKVVVYVAHDQIFSEPLLQKFQLEHKIRVDALYDVETNKSVGFVNRLLAERDNTQADVFWNNENTRTIFLQKEGILFPYNSPDSTRFPEVCKDPDGYWTGFAARMRVLVYNKKTTKNETLPKSLDELIDHRWKNRVAMANPLFGTTGPHLAAILSLKGEEWMRAYLVGLKNNGIRIASSNSHVVRLVKDEICDIGITDSDDANGALLDCENIGVIVLPKIEDRIFLIPNTVSIINDAPHIEEAKEFVDYILSEDAEISLSLSRAAQLPLGCSSNIPDIFKGVLIENKKVIPPEEIYRHLGTVIKLVKDVFQDL